MAALFYGPISNKMEKFEGPEKKLEVILSAAQTGLRDNADGRWNSVVRACGAEILKRESGKKLDSYLLSESSLFIWDDRILIITCGRTTPAKAVPILLEHIDKNKISYLFYERKNLNFPDEQPTDFDDDAAYLRNYFPGKTIRLGQTIRDHVHIFYFASPNGCASPDASLQILMHDIDPAAGKIFYLNNNTNLQRKMISNLTDLYPTMRVDDHFFYPQGYSLNGFAETKYFTIHVTPQPEASYASFESNLIDRHPQDIIQNIISIFKPQRYSLIFTTCTNGQGATPHIAGSLNQPGYEIVDRMNYEFDRRYSTSFSNFLKQRH